MSVIEGYATADGALTPAPSQGGVVAASFDFDRRLRVTSGPPTGNTAPTTNRAKSADFQAQAAGAGKAMRFFSFRETAGAVGSFRLYQGTSNAGVEICSVSLVANQSDVKALSIDASAGIFCERLAGTFDLTIIP